MFPLPPSSKTFVPVLLPCTCLALLRRTLRSFLALLSYTNSALYFSAVWWPLLPSPTSSSSVASIIHRSCPNRLSPPPLGTYYRPIANCYYGQLVASDVLTRFSLLFSYNFLRRHLQVTRFSLFFGRFLFISWLIHLDCPGLLRIDRACRPFRQLRTVGEHGVE